jgi:hypothetical protein
MGVKEEKVPRLDMEVDLEEEGRMLIEYARTAAKEGRSLHEVEGVILRQFSRFMAQSVGRDQAA